MVSLNRRLEKARDATSLLREAAHSGLIAWRDGSRLRVYGPVEAADLARRLLRMKEDVLSALDVDAAPPAPATPHRWNRPPTPWCPYGHPAAWRSRYGPHWICETCHTPVTPAAVVETTSLRPSDPLPL